MKLKLFSACVMLTIAFFCKAQTFTSNVQFENRSDGFKKYTYYHITIVKKQNILKITNSIMPNSAFYYTLNQRGEPTELTDRSGIVTQFIVEQNDPNFAAVYSHILFGENYNLTKLDDEHSYQYIFVMITKNIDGDIKEMTKYFCNLD